MSTAPQFPIPVAPEGRRPFQAEGLWRRIAKLANWGSASRILELNGSAAGFYYAREVGARVVLAESDAQALDQVRDRVQAHGLADRVETTSVNYPALDGVDGPFDGILAVGSVPLRLSDAADLRRLLGPRGRLVLTYPVKVGRFPLKNALDLWEERLGEPLRYPREVLAHFEAKGFEPDTIESMSDADLDDHYRALEASLAQASPTAARMWKEEMDLHRAQGGKAAVSLALAVVRRKEPGEKPPVSRDAG